MANSVVQYHRSKVPNDPRTDAELTLLIGDQNPGQFDGYTDFKAEYDALKLDERRRYAPPLGTEFSRGFSTGVSGLKATGYGALALAADLPRAIGADMTGLEESNPARDWALRKSMEASREASQNPATIGSMSEISSPSDAVRYAASAAGQVLPSALEAAGTAVAGGIVGSTLGPAGAGEGFLSGLLNRQAIKTLVKKAAKESLLPDEVDAIERLAKGEMTDLAKNLVAREARDMGIRYGQNALSALNSYALSAGEIYADLSQKPGVDLDRAFNLSFLGGLIAAAPDTVLPSYITSKYFKGVKEADLEPAKNALYSYLTRLGPEMVKTVGAEATTEGFQEWVNIAASKAAEGNWDLNPANWSKAELQRIMDAAAMGGIGGGMFGPVAAIPGGRQAPTPEPEPVQQQAPPPAPAPAPVQPKVGTTVPSPTPPLAPGMSRSTTTINGKTTVVEAPMFTSIIPTLPAEVRQYFDGIPEDTLRGIERIAKNSAEGKPGSDDSVTLNVLSYRPQWKAAFNTLKDAYEKMAGGPLTIDVTPTPAQMGTTVPTPAAPSEPSAPVATVAQPTAQTPSEASEDQINELADKLNQIQEIRAKAAQEQISGRASANDATLTPGSVVAEPTPLPVQEQPVAPTPADQARIAAFREASMEETEDVPVKPTPAQVQEAPKQLSPEQERLKLEFEKALKEYTDFMNADNTAMGQQKFGFEQSKKYSKIVEAENAFRKSVEASGMKFQKIMPESWSKYEKKLAESNSKTVVAEEAPAPTPEPVAAPATPEPGTMVPSPVTTYPASEPAANVVNDKPVETVAQVAPVKQPNVSMTAQEAEGLLKIIDEELPIENWESADPEDIRMAIRTAIAGNQSVADRVNKYTSDNKLRPVDVATAIEDWIEEEVLAHLFNTKGSREGIVNALSGKLIAGEGDIVIAEAPEARRGKVVASGMASNVSPVGNEIISLMDFEAAHTTLGNSSKEKTEGKGKHKSGKVAAYETEEMGRKSLFTDTTASRKEPSKSRKLGVFLMPDKKTVMIGTASKNGGEPFLTVEVTFKNGTKKVQGKSMKNVDKEMGLTYLATLKTTDPTKHFYRTMTTDEWNAAVEQIEGMMTGSRSGIAAVNKDVVLGRVTESGRDETAAGMTSFVVGNEEKTKASGVYKTEDWSELEVPNVKSVEVAGDEANKLVKLIGSPAHWDGMDANSVRAEIVEAIARIPSLYNRVKNYILTSELDAVEEFYNVADNIYGIYLEEFSDAGKTDSIAKLLTGAVVSRESTTRPGGEKTVRPDEQNTSSPPRTDSQGGEAGPQSGTEQRRTIIGRTATVTPAQDAAYMEAANRGDTETAQRMVDEAAKAAGYTIGRVFHGTDERRNVFNGGAFFTDSRRDASAYAEMKSLQRAVDESDDLSEIVSDILAEEGGETLTDLGPKLVREIAEANGIPLKLNAGHVFGGHLKVEKPLDLTQYGSDVGAAKTLWDRLHKDGLLEENWSDLDSEVQAEIKDKYNGKALYRFLEDEGVQAKAFEKGYDAVVFTDISPDGGREHTSWLTKSNTQFKTSDPITRDDNGNVIPLSQRFNQANEDIRYSRTSPLAATSLQIAQTLKEIVGYAAATGINVELYQQRVDGLVSQFANEEGGLYADGVIALIMRDLQNPTKENLRSLLHEIGHHLFATESPQMQQMIRNAIDGMTDVQLGITGTADPRINEANTGSLSKAVLSEERFAEWLALAGIDGALAKTIAARIVRLLKDWYIRAGIAIQQLRFGDDRVNPALIQAYAQNRFNRMIAGDIGWFNELGWKTPPKVTQAKQFTPANGGGWVAEFYNWKEDRMEYESMVPDSVAAMIWNSGAEDVRRTAPVSRERPEPLGPDFRTNVPTDIAANNAVGDSLSTLYRKAVASGTAMNMSFPEWVKTMGERNPFDRNVKANEQLKSYDGGPDLDLQTRVGNLPAEQVRQMALRKAVYMAKRIAARWEKRSLRTDKLIAGVNLQIQRVAQRASDLNTKYNDASALAAASLDGMRDLISEFKNDAKAIKDEAVRLGMVRQIITQIRADMLSKPQSDVASILDTLASSLAGNPTRLTDMLYAVSRLPIQWSKIPMSRVQELVTMAAASDPVLRDLTADTDASRTLLALVAAFAKKHGRILAMMEHRASKNVQDREAINQFLKEAMTDLDKDMNEARKGLGRVVRDTRVAERLYAAIREQKQQMRQLVEKRDRHQLFEDTYKATIGTFTNEIERMEQDLGVTGEPFAMNNGATLFVPTSDSQSPDEVVKQKQTFTLDKDIRPEVAQWMKQMKAWIDYTTPDGTPRPQGSTYLRVKDQYDKLSMYAASGKRNSIMDSMIVRVFGDMATAMRTLGVPAGSLVIRRMNDYVAKIKQHENREATAGLRCSLAMANAMKALGMKGHDTDVYLDLFHNEACSYFSSRTDLNNEPDAEGAKIEAWRQYMASSSDKRWQKAATGPAWASLRTYYHEIAKANAARKQTAQSMGAGVWDDAIKAVRGLIGDNLTIARHMRGHMQTVLNQINELWMGTTVPTSEDYAQAISDGTAQQFVGRFFNEDIIHDFVEPLVNVTGRTVFAEPVRGDGLKPLARSEAIQDAWARANGDVFTFAMNLYENCDGDMADVAAQGAYVADVMHTFQSYAKLLNNTVSERNKSISLGFSGMPHRLMDARVADIMPVEWVQYESYDQNTARQYVHEAAYHAAFGRDGEAVKDEFRQAQSQLVDYRTKRDRMVEEIRSKNPGISNFKLNRKLAEMAKKQNLPVNLIVDIDKKMATANATPERFSAWFKAQRDDFVEARSFLEVLHTITGMMVQGPKTVMLDTLTMFNPFLKYGINRTGLKAVKQNWVGIKNNAIGSVLQIFGHTYQAGSGWMALRDRLGYIYPENQFSMTERTKAILATNQGATSYARVVRDVLLNSGLGSGKYAKFRPTAMFTMGGQWMNAAAIESAWLTYSDFVSKAVAATASNRMLMDQVMNDPKFEFQASDLGYKNGLLFSDERAFAALKNVLMEYGMTLEGLTRAYYERQAANPSDVKLFTDDQFAHIASMAMTEMNSEPSIVSRPSWAGNTAAKYVMPLLGWSFDRMKQLQQASREPNGQFTWQAVKDAVGVLAVIMPVGLAYSLAAEEYDEKATGKKANIRGFGQENDLLAAWERLTRVGTFGLWGDVGNTIGNLAGQGDMRGISVDGRVIAVNSIMGFMTSIGTWINQGGATYDTVYRPMLSSLGGSGYFQYAQILNKVTGADNVESRITARINANNYLRTSGREAGLEVRIGRGAAGLPTEYPNSIRPWIAKMELAAIANDAGDFAEAYQKARAAALDEGKPDPEDYVRRAFASRHPFRSVFKTPPSEQEISKLMAIMPEDGQRDVSEAVRLFNAYGQQIGVKPYTGSTKAKAAESKAAFDPRRKLEFMKSAF